MKIGASQAPAKIKYTSTPHDFISAFYFWLSKNRNVQTFVIMVISDLTRLIDLELAQISKYLIINVYSINFAKN